MKLFEPAPPAKDMEVRLKHNEFRDLVNELRDTADRYGGTDQLRDQLAHTLARRVRPVPEIVKMRPVLERIDARLACDVLSASSTVEVLKLARDEIMVLAEEVRELRAALQHEAERDELRAKTERMEKQEPVATVIKEGDSRYWMSERLWTFPDGKYPLYALPGAQPAPSLASDDVSLISEGNTQPAQCVKDAIIDDLQSQFDTEGITEHDSGDALIRLSDAIAAVEDNFAQPAPGAPWVSLAERMPNPDKHDRVLIYTEGYDFGGEQVFDVKAEALNECRYIDPDEQPETCKAASHWMPHPRNAIFDYAAHCAQPMPSVPTALLVAIADLVTQMEIVSRVGFVDTPDDKDSCAAFCVAEGTWLELMSAIESLASALAAAPKPEGE